MAYARSRWGVAVLIAACSALTVNAPAQAAIRHTGRRRTVLSPAQKSRPAPLELSPVRHLQAPGAGRRQEITRKRRIALLNIAAQIFSYQTGQWSLYHATRWHYRNVRSKVLDVDAPTKTAGAGWCGT